MNWRTANNRKRPMWRVVGGDYVKHVRGQGVIWHPETCWDGSPWPQPDRASQEDGTQP
jgi:hypothetical protein